MTKEQEKNVRAWVKALRSGEYKQGQGQLRKYNSFCCLGVACEISGSSYEGDRAYPSQEIATQIYGLQTRGGALELTPDCPHYQRIADFYDPYGGGVGITNVELAGLNDGPGLTFDQIADIIEHRPEGLFVD